MWLRKICLICAFLVVKTQDYGDDDENTNTTEHIEKENEKKLSETILALLEHFKQPDPIGLPGEILPDPCPIPDSKQYMPFGLMMYFKDTGLYGTSQIQILHINADIQRMEVQGALRIDALQSRGNYTLSSWFDSTDGSYTVNMTNLNVTGITTLGAEIDGQLKVQNINIDLALDTITTDFNNLGVLGGIFQSVLNSGGFSFDSMKPRMLEDAYTNIRTNVDTKLDNFVGDYRFPNSISALDNLFINVRETIRDMYLDPYHIQNYNQTFNPVTISLFNTWVLGLSSVQRVGNVTFKLENNTAVTEFEMGTRKLEGTTHWDISTIGGFISKNGTASFSIAYISTKIILAQPLDIRKNPVFKDLHIDIGNIQVRCNGLGTLDYVLELAVNILPNLLRYQIVGAIERPLKERIQQELEQLNVEDLIKSELPKLDEMQDFILSDLISTDMEDKVYDEDEFFNF